MSDPSGAATASTLGFCCICGAARAWRWLRDGRTGGRVARDGRASRDVSWTVHVPTFESSHCQWADIRELEGRGSDSGHGEARCVGTSLWPAGGRARLRALLSAPCPSVVYPSDLCRFPTASVPLHSRACPECLRPPHPPISSNNRRRSQAPELRSFALLVRVSIFRAAFKHRSRPLTAAPAGNGLLPGPGTLTHNDAH